MITSTAIAQPKFENIKSFLAYAVGEERIEVRPEWAGVLAPAAAVARKAAA